MAIIQPLLLLLKVKKDISNMELTFIASLGREVTEIPSVNLLYITESHLAFKNVSLHHGSYLLRYVLQFCIIRNESRVAREYKS
jgi:hypothetical protein